MVLAPSEVAFACPGCLLSLTCSSNETYLEWAVEVPGNAMEMQIFDSYGDVSTVELEPAIIGSTTFNFSREVNVSMDLFLISMILIENALNGTTINCTETANGIRSTLTTNIHIVGNEADYSKLI